MQKSRCKLIGSFLLLTAIWIASCEKVPSVIDDSLTVDKAKQWYEEYQSGFVTLKSASDNAPFILVPEWSQAFATKNDDYEVVESDVISQGRICLATEESMEAFETTDEQGYLNSFPRLVVMKDKKTGAMESFLMTMVATKEYLEKHKFELWNNSYLKKQKDFCGMVLYHSLGGIFVNGWVFENGVATHTVTPSSEDDGGSNIQLSSLKATQSCYVVTVYEITEHCTDWYTNGEYTHTSCNGTTTRVLYTYTVCDASGGGSGGSGGGGYNPGGGSQAGGAALNAIKKYVNLTLSQTNKLEIALAEYINDCANNQVYLALRDGGVKLGFRIAGDTPAAYKPTDREIIFKEEATIYKRYLAEEMFHAYQDYIYPGGTGRFLHQKGHYNIEVEAKLYTDMLCVVRSGECQQALNFNVTVGGTVWSWPGFILQVTNNGTRIPDTLSPNNLTIYYAFVQKMATNEGRANLADMTMAPDKLFDFVRTKLSSDCKTH